MEVCPNLGGGGGNRMTHPIATALREGTTDPATLRQAAEIIDAAAVVIDSEYYLYLRLAFPEVTALDNFRELLATPTEADA